MWPDIAEAARQEQAGDRGTVCVDFDGVLADYRGWQGDAVGKPILTGCELVRRLHGMGYRVVVLSSRPSHLIEPWLRRHGLRPFVHDVTDHKVPALGYVDDRAVRFDPAMDVRHIIQAVQERTWWQREG